MAIFAAASQRLRSHLSSSWERFCSLYFQHLEDEGEVVCAVTYTCENSGEKQVAATLRLGSVEDDTTYVLLDELIKQLRTDVEVVDVRRTIKLGKDESAPPLIRVTGGKNKRCSSPDGRTKRRSLNPLSPPRRSKSITFEICVSNNGWNNNQQCCSD